MKETKGLCTDDGTTTTAAQTLGSTRVSGMSYLQAQLKARKSELAELLDRVCRCPEWQNVVL